MFGEMLQGLMRGQSVEAYGSLWVIWHYIGIAKDDDGYYNLALATPAEAELPCAISVIRYREHPENVEPAPSTDPVSPSK